MNKKIGFIGAGNMATAIINGLITSKTCDAQSLYVYDPDAYKLSLMDRRRINTLDSGASVTQESDIVVLAVKPQVYGDVLSQIKQNATENKVFVSIAAGISIGFVREHIGFDCKVVRVMPNTPLLLSKGATAMCPSSNVTEDDFSAVYKLFSLGSTVEKIEEKHMNEIIAVNGSSPAYIYLFAKAMVDYAVDCGIDEKKALNLVCATLEGSAKMLRESGDDTDTLIKKVSSPGGTTIAALDSLDKSGFYAAVKQAMDACTKRATELGKWNK